MIEKMYLNYTFKRSEIQNGDIICFQKALMENEYALKLSCYYFFFNTQYLFMT
jgi:hypothetical protein